MERKGIMAWNEVSEVDSSKGIYTVCGKLWFGMYVYNLYVRVIYALLYCLPTLDTRASHFWVAFMVVVCSKRR